MKLTPNEGNSGIQFRSEPLPDGEMKGPQADIGAGWWGKLYEENGRGLLGKEGGEKYRQAGRVERLRDRGDRRERAKLDQRQRLLRPEDDDKLSRRGIFGFQLHSGGAQEVRFKDLKLEVLPKK